MTQQTTFAQHIAFFLQELEGGNKSQLTLTAYKTDLSQFFKWLSENDVTVYGGPKSQIFPHFPCWFYNPCS